MLVARCNVCRADPCVCEELQDERVPYPPPPWTDSSDTEGAVAGGGAAGRGAGAVGGGGGGGGAQPVQAVCRYRDLGDPPATIAEARAEWLAAIAAAAARPPSPMVNLARGSGRRAARSVRLGAVEREADREQTVQVFPGQHARRKTALAALSDGPRPPRHQPQRQHERRRRRRRLGQRRRRRQLGQRRRRRWRRLSARLGGRRRRRRGAAAGQRRRRRDARRLCGQEDAHEFLVEVLHAVQKEVMRAEQAAEDEDARRAEAEAEAGAEPAGAEGRRRRRPTGREDDNDTAKADTDGAKAGAAAAAAAGIKEEEPPRPCQGPRAKRLPPPPPQPQPQPPPRSARRSPSLATASTPSKLPSTKALVSQRKRRRPFASGRWRPPAAAAAAVAAAMRAPGRATLAQDGAAARPATTRARPDLALQPRRRRRAQHLTPRAAAAAKPAAGPAPARRQRPRRPPRRPVGSRAAASARGEG